MESEKMENAQKWIVKIYEVYPVWADGQVKGAIICNNKDEAEDIAKEINHEALNSHVLDEMNTRAEIAFETDEMIRREWAEDIHRLGEHYHYDVKGLNIIDSEEYYEKGLEDIVDFDPYDAEAIFDENGHFLCWYEDAIYDDDGNYVGCHDNNDPR